MWIKCLIDLCVSDISKMQKKNGPGILEDQVFRLLRKKKRVSPVRVRGGKGRDDWAQRGCIAMRIAVSH